jgi:hypothetical protein
MKIYRTNSVLSLSVWEEKKRVFFELSPALEGVKGQPKPGEQRYDYSKACKISFRVLDCFTAAYNFMALAQGADVEMKKFADMSKSVGAGDQKKSLNVKRGTNGNVQVYMKDGDNSANIGLSSEEAYAVSKWLEVNAQRWAVEEALGDDAKRREAILNKED